MNTTHPSSRWTVCALYRFVKIDDRETLQKEIKEICDAQDICGTILIAPEGVNGTVGAPTFEKMNILIDHLDARVRVRQGEVKYSEAHKRPFIRTKIRLKKRNRHAAPTAGRPDDDRWNLCRSERLERPYQRSGRYRP